MLVVRKSANVNSVVVFSYLDDASLWETAQAHQLSATAAYSALALPPSNVYDNSSPQLNIMNHCQTCSTTLSKPLRAPWDGSTDNLVFPFSPLLTNGCLPVTGDNLSGASGTAKPRTVLESTGPQDPIAAKRDYLSPSLSAHKYRKLTGFFLTTMFQPQHCDTFTLRLFFFPPCFSRYEAI